MKETPMCNGFLNGKHCFKSAIVLYDGTPYCVKHYRIISKKQQEIKDE